MNTEKITATTLIIDALLVRMSKLDRYSDDETVISNDDLDMLDVVTDGDGHFGVVHSVVLFDVNYYINFMCADQMRVMNKSLENTACVRTITELEACQAREKLMGSLTYVCNFRSKQ